MDRGEVVPLDDRNSFLASYFRDDFESLNPKWREFETISADWRVVAIPNDGNRMIIAVRTSPMGDIDSFGICLDEPDEAHIHIDDRDMTLFGVAEDAQAQIDMGLTAPIAEDTEKLDELINTLRLFSSI